MKFENCVHCGRTEPDPVLGKVDAIGWCSRCGHPVCSDTSCSSWDAEAVGDPLEWIGECQCVKCPPVHHEDCECMKCLEESICCAHECDNPLDPESRGMSLCSDCMAQRWEEVWRNELELA